jgi:hypothetical protein
VVVIAKNQDALNYIANASKNNCFVENIAIVIVVETTLKTNKSISKQ